MKRIYYVCNLQAGKAAISNKLGGVLDLMTKAGFEVTVRPTQAAKEAVALTKAAAESGEYTYVFCSGGDGTLNEVMGGMLLAERRVPIGYIPCGSINDFARSIGIPRGILRAAEASLGGIPRTFDVGTVNDRSFTYVAAFGAFTDVTYETSQHAKNVLGPIAYAFNILPKLTNLRPYPMRITCDEKVIEGAFAFGMITNTASVGGFLNINDFCYNDGIFEVTLMKLPGTPMEFQKTLTFLTGLDDSGDDNSVITFRASNIKIELLEELNVPWTVDGEYLENASTLHIINHKQAVSILVPATNDGKCFQ